MELIMEFKILNWNVARAKYLEGPPEERERFRDKLNDELRTLIRMYDPHVVTLQEIVKYVQKTTDIIDPPGGFPVS
jgi:hypothetical protein